MPILIDISRHGFIIEPRYYFYGWSKTPTIHVEKKLLERLIVARKHLPRGYTFKIWDCRRPRAVQLLMIASFKKRIRAAYPHASREERARLVRSFAARPLRRVTRPDTHRNGGAVDLTIVDAQGRELYMGTDHDDLTERAETAYYKHSQGTNYLDRIAKGNRNLLIRALTAAGLRNYHREWWHWYLPRPEELEAEQKNHETPTSTFRTNPRLPRRRQRQNNSGPRPRSPRRGPR